jgi:hypothetical protein
MKAEGSDIHAPQIAVDGVGLSSAYTVSLDAGNTERFRTIIFIPPLSGLHQFCPPPDQIDIAISTAEK